jgi:hypothetical protein
VVIAHPWNSQTPDPIPPSPPEICPSHWQAWEQSCLSLKLDNILAIAPLRTMPPGGGLLCGATIHRLSKNYRASRSLSRQEFPYFERVEEYNRIFDWNALQQRNGFELLHAFSFYLCGRTSCAKLHAMISIYSGRNKRARISIAVYLRLTSMDVCCGPPASL